MSSYRDDTQETLIISNSTVGRMLGIAEEVLKITNALPFQLTALLEDGLLVSDEVLDSRGVATADSVQIADSVLDQLHATQSITNTFKIKDHDISILRKQELVEDTLTLTELITEHLTGFAVEQFTVADEVVTHQSSHVLIQDHLKGKDQFTGKLHASVQWDDGLIATDTVLGRVRVLSSDSLTVADIGLGQKHSQQLISDKLKIKDSVQAKLSVLEHITDSLVVTDTVLESQLTLIQDSVMLADSVLDKKYSQQLISDKLKVQDSTNKQTHYQDMLVDTLACNEQFSHRLRASITERLVLSESLHGHNHAAVLCADTVRVTDYSGLVSTQTIEEQLYCDEQHSGKLHASNIATDSVAVADELRQQIRFSNVIVEKLQADNTIQDKLSAYTRVADALFIDDLIIGDSAVTGIAWTANIDNWAMSQYQQYDFERLSVIDNVLYGENATGIYRIDAAKTVNGRIVTGKLDLGQGGLVHPLGAYLEYALVGENKRLDLAVTTTQSGQAQQYHYVLPNEVADELTNGRVLLGRGLRGRHFSFALNITASKAYINDLNIEFTATKRRI